MLIFINRVFNMFLHTIIRKCPDALIPDTSDKNHPFKILMAFAEDGENITQKIILYVSKKLDINSDTGKSHIDLHDFGNIVGASFLWIAYVLKNDKVDEVLDSDVAHEVKKIYSMSVDLKNNIVKKYKISKNASRTFLSEDEILFHQCPMP